MESSENRGLNNEYFPIETWNYRQVNANSNDINAQLSNQLKRIEKNENRIKFRVARR